MKKKISIILLVTILIMCICNNLVVNASDVKFGEDESLSELMNGSEPDNFNKLEESGETSTNGEVRQENVSIAPKSGTMDIIVRLVCKLLCAIPTIINKVMAEIVDDSNGTFSIQKTITNQYELFDIDYLILTQTPSSDSKNLLEPISTNIALWFVGIRNLALVGSVITLIYIGIRLAVAVGVQERADYKKILFSWFEGLAILLLLQFFIILVIYLSDFATGILKKTLELDTSVESTEEKILNNIYGYLDKAKSVQATIFYTTLFLMFVYYEVKFFALYFGRLLRVAFYIIISPLVCLTYPIDKVGDGRPQGFNNWCTEIIVTCFMQPVHLLIYIVMMYSTGEILARNPVLAIMFLAGLSHAEKTFKSVLKLKPSLGKGLEDINLKDFVK